MSVISFVILHYGNVQVTKECVNSILQLHTEDDIHIVVVDNDTNKSDEERQVLKQEVLVDSRIEVLEIKEKSGFSKANNEGYAYTRRLHKPDYVIMTNNDIVFEQKGFIAKMKESYLKNSYAVLSPDIVSRENGQHQSPIDTRVRKMWQVNYTIVMNKLCLVFFGLVYPLIKRQLQKSNIEVSPQLIYQEAIVPCGACIVFSRDYIMHEEKAFYPETEFYYEEYILHYRCKMLEYKIIFEPMLQVLHGDGVATKKRTFDERKRIRFMMENTLQSAKLYREYVKSNGTL